MFRPPIASRVTLSRRRTQSADPLASVHRRRCRARLTSAPRGAQCRYMCTHLAFLPASRDRNVVKSSPGGSGAAFSACSGPQSGVTAIKLSSSAGGNMGFVLALGVMGGGAGVAGRMLLPAGPFVGVGVAGSFRRVALELAASRLRFLGVTGVAGGSIAPIEVVCVRANGDCGSPGVLLGVAGSDLRGVEESLEGGSAPCAASTQRRRPFWTPRSPTGRTSPRRSVKIRNISTVHFPMPLTAVRAASTSSSGAERRASVDKRPAAKCPASSITDS